MPLPRIARQLYIIATFYFALAVSMGVYMGASQDHSLLQVHAHFNLLGWVSLALIGGIYQLNPKLGETRLARVHFWLHNIGMPLMLLGVGMIYSGGPMEIAEPLAGIFSVVTMLGVFAFCINLWRGLMKA